MLQFLQLTERKSHQKNPLLYGLQNNLTND